MSALAAIKSSGDAHRGIREHRRGEVEKRVSRFRQDRQRAGHDADYRLGRGQRARRQLSIPARLFPCRSMPRTHQKRAFGMRPAVTAGPQGRGSRRSSAERHCGQ